MGEHKIGEQLYKEKPQITDARHQKKGIRDALAEAWGREGKPHSAAEQQAFSRKAAEYDKKLHEKGPPPGALYNKGDLHVVGIEGSGKIIIAQIPEGKQHASALFVVNDKGIIVKRTDCDADGKAKGWKTSESPAPGSDKPGSDKPGSDKPGSDKPGSDKPGSDKPIHTTVDDQGNTTQEFKDRSTVTTDKQGHVTRTTDAQGKTRKIEYDGSGKANSYTDGHGHKWTRHSDNTWKDDETKPKTCKDVSVDQAGNITIKNNDDSTTSHNRDGSTKNTDNTGASITDYPDGSQVKSNKAGLVTEVHGAKGASGAFEYDATGKIVKSYTDEQGTKWVKQSDGSWKSGDTKAPFKDVSVDNNGNITETKDDNSSTVFNRDGSVIQMDKTGRITNALYAAGLVHDFRYDARNKLNYYLDGDGHAWTRQTDDTWKDNEKPPKSCKNISVDQAGNVTVDNNDGTTIVYRRDGCVAATDNQGDTTTTYPDKSKVKVNEAGHVTEVTTPKPVIRTISYDDSGQPYRIDGPTGHWFRKADGTWKNEDSGATWTGKVTVDNQGTISWKNNDGSSEEYQRDGTYILTDSQGHWKKYNPDGSVLAQGTQT